MKRHLVQNLFLITNVLLLAGAAGLHGATDIWTGAFGDNNWNTTTNWNGNAVPVANDLIVFGNQGAGGLTLNNNLTAGTVFAGLTFNATAPSFILNGNSISSSASVADNSLNPQTIGLPIIFSSTHSMNAVAGGTMNIKGVVSGAGGVTKTGGGTVAFNGTTPHTYTGITAVNGGTLTLDFVTGAPGNNLVNSASVLSLGGGTLSLLGTGSSASSSQTFASTTIASSASTVSVNNSAALALGAITYTAGSAVQFVGPATINGAGNVAAVGTITTTSAGATGTGQLGVIGNDNAANSIGHYATVGLFDWASTDTTAGANGTSPYTIIGGSQVTGFYTTTAPATTGNGGNFDMQANATIANAAAQRACATVRFNTPAATTFNIGNNLLTCGGILVTPNMAANNAVVTGSGVWQVVRTTSNGSQQGVIWQNNVSGFLSYNSVISDGRQGTSTPTSLVQAGPGTVFFGALNTYTALTYLDGGVSEITNNSAFGAPASFKAVTLNGGTILANSSLSLDNGTAATARPITLGNIGGGLAATAGNTLTVSGVISGGGQLVVGIPASSANGNVVGQVPGTGTGAANTAQIASGTVALTNINTYSGNTIVSSGTLQLTNTGSIASSPSITVASGAVLDVSPISFTLGGSQSLLGSGTNNGSVNTTAGSSVYAGTDGGYGTNTFNNNLTFAAASQCFMDVGTVYNGSNDFISVAGTLTLNSTSFRLKAPSNAANLDTTADYLLATAGSISGSPASSPVWDVAPANAANFLVVKSGNSIYLHYASSTPPSALGTATPSSVNRNGSTLITVTVTPGSNPLSTVTLDATLIGGSASVSLVQSNASTVYTNTITVSAGTSPGLKALTATATDNAALSGTANISLTVLSTQKWNGGAGDDNWTSGANWISGVAPVTGDNLTFAGAVRLTPSMDTIYNVTGLAFDSTASSFVLGTPGNSLTLSGNGITNNSASAQVINLPITLSAAQSFNASAGDLTFNQPITNGGFVLAADGARNTSIGAAITGNGGLAKNGAGTVTLTATNTYSGANNVNAGVLQVNAGGAVNCLSAAVVAGSTAQISVAGGSFTATNSSNLGSPSSGLLVSSGTANFLGGLTTDLGNNNTVAVVATGGSLNAASLTLGRTSLSYTTQPAGGDTGRGLYVNGAGANVNITGNLNMGTAATANSSVNCRIDNGSLAVGGVLTVGLNNGTRWSIVDVNGGTLSVNDTNTGIQIGGPFSGPAVLLVRNGTATAGKISFGQASSGSTNMNAVVNLNGGSLYVGSGGMAQVSTGAGFNSVINLNSGILGATNDWSSSLNMTLGGATIQAADASGGAHNITLTGLLGGTTLTKTGNGTLTLNSAGNFYTGLTTVNAGTLNINSEWALGGANYAGLTFNGGTLQYAATLLNSTTDLSFKPVTVNSNATIDVNGNSINFALGIGNGGSGGLNLASTAANGVLFLQGTNTYTGATTISSGVTLGGAGIILGPVTNLVGGTLQPGLTAGDTSTLTISNSLTLAGSTLFTLNRTNALNSSRISGITAANYGGALIVSNAATALQAGDTFTLFSAGSYSGSFSSVTLPTLTGGLVWTNKLAINGTIAVVNPVPTAATNVIINPIVLGNGSFQFAFTNYPGTTFTVLATTNLALPLTSWSNLGAAVESPANSGQFQFNDPQATNYPNRFYNVRTP